MIDLKKHRLNYLITMFFVAILIPIYLIFTSLVNTHINTLTKGASDFNGSRIYVNFEANKNTFFEDKKLISPILESDMSSIRKLKNIKRVSGVNQTFNHSLADIKLKDKVLNVELYPFNEDGYDIATNHFEIIEGRNIKIDDIDKNVIVLNKNTVKLLGFENTTDILNKQVEINKEKFEVVGVLEVKDNIDLKKIKSDNNYFYSNSNLIAKSTFTEFEGLEFISNTSLTSISIDVFEGANLDSIQKDITKILKDSHKDIDGSYIKILKECYSMDYVNGIKEKVKLIEFAILFVIFIIILLLDIRLLKNMRLNSLKGLKLFVLILIVAIIVSLISFVLGKGTTILSLNLIQSIKAVNLRIDKSKEIIVLTLLMINSFIATVIGFLQVK